MNQLVFISSTTWAQYLSDQFRTRQGALLRQFCRTPQIKQIFVVTETGWGGKMGVEEIIAPDGAHITQVYVPGRLPERLLRPFGIRALQCNYILPFLMKRLSDQSLLWSYSIGLGSRLLAFNKSRLYYDVIDYRPDDPNLTVWQRDMWDKELTIACHVADRIICNGEKAFGELSKKAGDKCMIVRNGIDPERFQNHRKNKERNGVGFVGVISQWIDFGLIEKMLARLPHIPFKFRGITRSFTNKIDALSHYPNFKWGGEISPSEVPEFLSGCQLAILPYNIASSIESTGDSMKIFEYLASGTPVISTAWQRGLQRKFNGLIQVYEDETEFINSVKSTYHTPIDSTWQEHAWQFVLANTWQNRVDQILNETQNKSFGQ